MSMTICEMRGGPKDGLREDVSDNTISVTYPRDVRSGWLYRRVVENPAVFVYVGVCDLCIRPNER